MKRLCLGLLLILVFLGGLFIAFKPLAKKSKSGLQVIITDSIATSVFLDNNYVEKTPFINKELNPGKYTLKIQPDDPKLIPYEAQITLRPGLLTVVTWKLAQRPEFSGGVIYEMEPINSKNKSEISFVTIPDGAIVAVNEKDKTFSPVIIDNIIPGNNGYEVSLPSYESQIHTINAIAGYRMIVTVKLAKVDLNNDTNENKPDEVEQTNVATKSATNIITPIANPMVSAYPTVPSVLPATQVSLASDSGQQVQIKPTGFFINEKEVLRVRDMPSSSGKELGFAQVGNSYPYLGQTQNSWLKIQFGSLEGFVSEQYAQLVP